MGSSQRVQASGTVLITRFAPGQDLSRPHALYDVLEVALRFYSGRENAASALKLSKGDLKELSRISNDPTISNDAIPHNRRDTESPPSPRSILACEWREACSTATRRRSLSNPRSHKTHLWDGGNRLRPPRRPAKPGAPEGILPPIGSQRRKGRAARRGKLKSGRKATIQAFA